MDKRNIKPKNKRGLIVILLALLCSFACITVGFASWVTIGGVNVRREGEISSENFQLTIIKDIECISNFDVGSFSSNSSNKFLDDSTGTYYPDSKSFNLTVASGKKARITAINITYGSGNTALELINGASFSKEGSSSGGVTTFSKEGFTVTIGSGYKFSAAQVMAFSGSSIRVASDDNETIIKSVIFTFVPGFAGGLSDGTYTASTSLIGYFDLNLTNMKENIDSFTSSDRKFSLSISLSSSPSTLTIGNPTLTGLSGATWSSTEKKFNVTLDAATYANASIANIMFSIPLTYAGSGAESAVFTLIIQPGEYIA